MECGRPIQQLKMQNVSIDQSAPQCGLKCEVLCVTHSYAMLSHGDSCPLQMLEVLHESDPLCSRVVSRVGPLALGNREKPISE
jgi:hypothetical protein